MCLQKSTLACLLALLFTIQLQSQNLVPNPSFEDYTGSLPCTWSPNFLNTIGPWDAPTDGTPDIYSMLVETSCYAHCLSTHSDSPGQQLPRTGDITVSILTYGAGCGSQPDYREYIQVELTEPLVVGETYYAEMYVSHGELSIEASNNIGFYFSETAIGSNLCTELNYVPQINETEIITEGDDWVKISGTFVATTAAAYMTIGNFYDNANTEVFINPSNTKINARYFVDDVYVGLSCGVTNESQELCAGESLTLYGFEGSDNTWVNSDDPGVIISTADTLIVGPTETMTYILYSGCDTIYNTIEVNTANTDVASFDDYLEALATDATYQWLDCDDGMSPIVGATGVTFAPEFNGNYAVSVTQNGCTAVSDCFEVIVLSDSDFVDELRPMVYPNPTIADTYIVFEHSDEMNIIIYDAAGKKVLQTVILQNGKVDLSAFPSGLYTVMINTEASSWTERVVKL